MAKGSKKDGGEKDKIPITSAQQLRDEYNAFKTNIMVKETEHTWEALDRTMKRFTAVTRGGGCRYEEDFVTGLKDRDLAKAIIGCLATERTQLSASALVFFTSATRLGPAFSPLFFIYLPHIIRLLSRTNKLYVSRATACLVAIIRNTRLASVLPYLREGMDEKAPSHRRGCIQGLLCALGGAEEDGVYRGIMVDREVLSRRYLDDVERMVKTGATDRDTEVRKTAKKCWEIYRAEFEQRVPAFAAPLTPIIRKYLELPAAGQAIHSKPTSSTMAPAPKARAQTSRPVSPTEVRHGVQRVARPEHNGKEPRQAPLLSQETHHPRQPSRKPATGLSASVGSSQSSAGDAGQAHPQDTRMPLNRSASRHFQPAPTQQPATQPPPVPVPTKSYFDFAPPSGPQYTSQPAAYHPPQPARERQPSHEILKSSHGPARHHQLHHQAPILQESQLHEQQQRHNQYYNQPFKPSHAAEAAQGQSYRHGPAQQRDQQTSGQALAQVAANPHGATTATTSSAPLPPPTRRQASRTGSSSVVTQQTHRQPGRAFVPIQAQPERRASPTEEAEEPYIQVPAKRPASVFSNGSARDAEDNEEAQGSKSRPPSRVATPVEASAPSSQQGSEKASPESIAMPASTVQPSQVAPSKPAANETMFHSQQEQTPQLPSAAGASDLPVSSSSQSAALQAPEIKPPPPLDLSKFPTRPAKRAPFRPARSATASSSSTAPPSLASSLSSSARPPASTSCAANRELSQSTSAQGKPAATQSKPPQLHDIRRMPSTQNIGDSAKLGTAALAQSRGAAAGRSVSTNRAQPISTTASTGWRSTSHPGVHTVSSARATAAPAHRPPPAKKQALSTISTTKSTASSASARNAASTAESAKAAPSGRAPVTRPTGSIFSRLTAPTASSSARAKESIAAHKASTAAGTKKPVISKPSSLASSRSKPTTSAPLSTSSSTKSLHDAPPTSNDSDKVDAMPGVEEASKAPGEGRERQTTQEVAKTVPLPDTPIRKEVLNDQQMQESAEESVQQRPGDAQYHQSQTLRPTISAVEQAADGNGTASQEAIEPSLSHQVQVDLESRNSAQSRSPPLHDLVYFSPTPATVVAAETVKPTASESSDVIDDQMDESSPAAMALDRRAPIAIDPELPPRSTSDREASPTSPKMPGSPTVTNNIRQSASRGDATRDDTIAQPEHDRGHGYLRRMSGSGTSPSKWHVPELRKAPQSPSKVARSDTTELATLAAQVSAEYSEARHEKDELDEQVDHTIPTRRRSKRASELVNITEQTSSPPATKGQGDEPPTPKLAPEWTLLDDQDGLTPTAAVSSGSGTGPEIVKSAPPSASRIAASIPLPDPSDSILFSPTKADYPDESTLLMQREPDNGEELDDSGEAPTPRKPVVSDSLDLASSDTDDAGSADEGARMGTSDSGTEDEDDVALLISRELSDDSLEELASRFETSRMLGNDLDADADEMEEATPMKARAEPVMVTDSDEDAGEETQILQMTSSRKKRVSNGGTDNILAGLNSSEL